jgi:hypothetical protein
MANWRVGTIHEQRIAARLLVREKMLRAYREILQSTESNHPTWFAAIIEGATKVIDQDSLLTTFSVSKTILNRWATGATAPLPHTHEIVLHQLRELVDLRLS